MKVQRTWARGSLGVFLLLLALAIPASATFPGKNGKIAFTGSNGDVFTMNPDGTDVTQLTLFSVNGGSTCCATWSPDGRQLVFGAEPGPPFISQLWLMNADGSNQVNLTPKNPVDPATSWCSRAPSWSTDGRQIYFMSFRPSTVGQNEIFIMNADGTNVHQLTNVGVSGSPRAR